MIDTSPPPNPDKRGMHLRKLAFHLIALIALIAVVVCCALTGAGYAYDMKSRPGGCRNAARRASSSRPTV